MDHFPYIIHGAVVLGGGIALAGIALSRRESVEQIAARIDTDLQQRLYAIIETYRTPAWTYKADLEFWRAIGGLHGVPHLLSQGRLLVRLVVEIRRQRPGDFQWEQGMLDGAAMPILFGLLGSLGETLIALIFPRVRCLGAKLSATVFCHLAAEVENICAEFQHGTP